MRLLRLMRLLLLLVSLAVLLLEKQDRCHGP
jgi:hypothetical protein